jgi:hypothetical protein
MPTAPVLGWKLKWCRICCLDVDEMEGDGLEDIQLIALDVQAKIVHLPAVHGLKGQQHRNIYMHRNSHVGKRGRLPLKYEQNTSMEMSIMRNKFLGLFGFEP